MKNWSCYLLSCSDGTYYCGVTKNMKKRLKKHNSGKGAKYTRNRRPVWCIAKVDGFTKSEAMKLEYKVKQQPRWNKVKFLKEHA